MFLLFWALFWVLKKALKVQHTILSVSLFWVSPLLSTFFEWPTHLSPLLSKATHLSLFLSKSTLLITFLSTQKSKFALKSTFLSVFALLSTFLSAQKSTQGPTEPTSLFPPFSVFNLSFSKQMFALSCTFDRSNVVDAGSERAWIEKFRIERRWNVETENKKRVAKQNS